MFYHLWLTHLLSKRGSNIVAGFNSSIFNSFTHTVRVFFNTTKIDKFSFTTKYISKNFFVVCFNPRSLLLYYKDKESLSYILNYYK